MLETQKLLLENMGDGLYKLVNDFKIKIKHYEDSIVLNYDIIESPKTHPIVMECRGLHLSLKDCSVISRAFTRFFNYGEEKESAFDFENALVQEKMDGSLCILYWHPYQERWFARTRGTAYGETNVGENNITFEELYLKAGGELKPYGLCRLHSHVFELVSPENRVVTPYEKPMLYYLASFDNRDSKEIDYDTGYSCLRNCGIKCERVKSFKFENIDLVKYEISRLRATDEGFVIKSRNGERLKIKNERWLQIFHCAAAGGVLTTAKALAIIDSGEAFEFLSYFPEYKEKFNAIQEVKEYICESSWAAYEHIEHIKDQKEFALEAQKSEFAPFIFALRQGKKWEDVWNKMTNDKKADRVKKILNSMQNNQE